MKILLIDAVKTLISSDADYNFETRALNKELADYLQSLDTKVIVVTNAPGDNYKKIRSLLTGYNFETFSLDHKPTKADPIYFARLLEYYGPEAEDCFYLDHKQENLDAAKTAGIEGALFTDNKQAIEVLKAL